MATTPVSTNDAARKETRKRSEALASAASSNQAWSIFLTCILFLGGAIGGAIGGTNSAHESEAVASGILGAIFGGAAGLAIGMFLYSQRRLHSEIARRMDDHFRSIEER